MKRNSHSFRIYLTLVLIVCGMVMLFIPSPLPASRAISAQDPNATLPSRKKMTTTKKARGNVVVVVTDTGATSELTPIPIGRSPNLTSAKFSAKYFGPQSDSDISLMLFLTGTKYRYSTGGTFGVIFYVDDVPLSKGKARHIPSVDKHPGEEVLHFYITTEEVGWLATASRLTLKTFNLDSNVRYDSFVFTPTALSEFKRFATSVRLIRSELSPQTELHLCH